MTLIAIYRRWRDRSRARDIYTAADKELGTLHGQLGAMSDPRERAKLLRQMADVQMVAARIHRNVFGPNPIPDEDGRDLADSHVYASMLYRVLSDVEHVVACGGRVGRNWRFHELGGSADRVLDRMAATPSLADRTAMLKDLYEAVQHHVGGQAAEVLWCLPSPGHSGWLPVAAKDDWRIERA